MTRSFFSRDFSRQTVTSLSRKGIEIVGRTYIPGTGEMPFATGETGYEVSDNGCSRVLTFRQVLEAAA